MFGHDNDNDQKQQDNAGAAPVISPAPDDLLTDVQPPAAASTPSFDTAAVSLGSTPSSDDDSPAAPAASEDPAPKATTRSAPDDQLLTPSDNDDLIHIKQSALQQLSPLVDHLDQTPEEKFRTTMMMIQAADDQSLIKTAYDAAKSITDDKVRAQALLDIINEINYFTQQQAS